MSSRLTAGTGRDPARHAPDGPRGDARGLHGINPPRPPLPFVQNHVDAAAVGKKETKVG